MQSCSAGVPGEKWKSNMAPLRHESCPRPFHSYVTVVFNPASRRLIVLSPSGRGTAGDSAVAAVDAADLSDVPLVAVFDSRQCSSFVGMTATGASPTSLTQRAG